MSIRSISLLLLPLLLWTSACTEDKPISKLFVDDFNRADIGSDYLNTGGPYEIVNGKLHIKGAYNHPLWLRKRLPESAEISFTVTSQTTDGDIKVEAWGDGRSHATSKGAYLATSYVFIFGGWGNAISALCRMDEHAADRIQRRDVRVEKGKSYRFTIRRQGSQIDWLIDDKPFLKLNDADPLTGKGHGYFGFNNWQSDLYFDDLRIKPL